MSQSQARSKNYRKQLKNSVVYKFGAILATFLAMPIMIKYLGVEKFGIWSTMLTLIGWVMMFDLGIGNGLRNKVSENLARDDEHKAAGFISTAYGIIGAVSFGLYSILFVASYFVPWQRVFNTDVVSNNDLRVAVAALGFFVFFNFWISLVTQIYHGLQRSSFVTFGQFISNSLALVFVFILYHLSESSLLQMVVAYGVALVFSNCVLSVLLFGSHTSLRPKPKLFDRTKISPLLSLGIKFFGIQLAVIVIFMTDRLIITQLFGPEEVTPYEVVFKMFSVFTILHSLILLPLWPAYSDAYTRGDMAWIRSTLKKQVSISFLFFAAALMLAAMGPAIVDVWIGKDVDISRSLYLFFAFFIIVSVWSNVFAYFVNAINRINVQLITSLFAAAINIPLSIFFASYMGLGLNGIVLATTISLSIYALVGPFQILRILR